MTDTMTSQNIDLSSWDTLYYYRICLYNEISDFYLRSKELNFTYSVELYTKLNFKVSNIQLKIRIEPNKNRGRNDC